jgi:hypothetical protein
MSRGHEVPKKAEVNEFWVSPGGAIEGSPGRQPWDRETARSAFLSAEGRCGERMLAATMHLMSKMAKAVI